MEKEKPHILIIDSDRIVRMTLSLMLERAGYKISEAFNGIQALEILMKNSGVDAIILDRNMSGMSCIDFIQRIHGLSSAIRKIPIITLTTHTEKNRVKASMIFGVFDVIFKPVDEVILKKVLENALCKNTS
jgi:CheY-like chemotaxis protein